MSRSTTTSPTITPHMSVLGRDGRDLNVGYHESPFLLNHSPADAAAAAAAATSSSPSSSTSNNNTSSKWWGKWKLPSTLPSASIFMTGDHGNVNDGGGANNNYNGAAGDDDNQHDDCASYTSMGEMPNDEESVASNNNTKPSLAILRNLALFHPTPSSDHTSSQQHHVRTTSTRNNDSVRFTSVADDEFVKPPAKEEAVRNDCSFFYQGLEDLPSATTPASPLGNQTIGSSVYNPLVPTPPRHRAAYRARFQQLNEEWRRHSDVYDDDNELWLQDEDDEAGTIDSSSLSVSNVLHSSLCWAQDGRILMTLPKDKVRLLMDEDLEPGILSVERGNPIQSNNGNNHHHKDEIMYVLTVDDNLYRRVIGEISDATSSRFGLHQFCTDEGRVDISVAVMCLLLVLLILLINTIIWPVD